jgi:hypothetical protein
MVIFYSYVNVYQRVLGLPPPCFRELWTATDDKLIHVVFCLAQRF